MGNTVHGAIIAGFLFEGIEGLLGGPGGGAGQLSYRGGLDEAAVECVLRVVGYDYFRQLLPSQWDPGEFGADSAESSTQDPPGFFIVVVFISAEAAAAEE